MYLKINDIGFFKSLLNVFKPKSHITFKISQNSTLLYSCGNQKFYLSIEKNLYETDIIENMFTVLTDHLIQSLDILRTDKFYINEDKIELKNENKTISIPLVLIKDDEYEELGEITTKFVVKPHTAIVFGLLTGLVSYEIEDSKLFLRKSTGEVIEEVEILNIDFLKLGNLKFDCNNDWAENLYNLKKHASEVMFGFDSNLLSVQFLFNRYEDSYLEIQVPRTIIFE